MERREFLRLSASACISLAGNGLTAAAPVRPNIVLIYADDLGYGDVSCYGATKIRTPNVDRLASQGLRFTQAHSPAATCTPSRYSLLTGEYAWRKKGTNILPGDARLIIEPGRTTLPSMLRQAGYATGAVGKWHLGLGAGNLDWNADIKPGPQEIGFDYSFLIPATGDRVPCVFVENRRVVGLDPCGSDSGELRRPVGTDPTGKEHPELLKVHPSHGHDQTIVNGISRIGYMSGGKAARWVDEEIADVLTGKAVSFIEQHRDRPFFLYFATHDIHVPRVPHPRFAGKSGLGPRGDVILQFDWCVGEILKAHRPVEARGEHADHRHQRQRSRGRRRLPGSGGRKVERAQAGRPLRGGKYSAFDAGTRVPFIVRWPGHVQTGRLRSAHRSDRFSGFVCRPDRRAAGRRGRAGQLQRPPGTARDIEGRARPFCGAGRRALADPGGVEVHRTEQGRADREEHQYRIGQ